MSDDRQHIDRVVAAYEEEIDTPSGIVTLRRSPPEAGVPDEIDTLFYLDSDTAIVATAGLSARPMEGPHPYLEIGYEFYGGCDPSARRPLARKLAHVGTAFLLDRQPVAPNLILRDLELLPFTRMRSGLVTDWPILAELFLAGSEPPVLLLRIIPLFDSEADFLRDRGPSLGLSELRSKGLEIENPLREPLM